MRIEVLILAALLLVRCNGNKNDNMPVRKTTGYDIECSGYVIVENEGLFEISAPIEGKILSVSVKPGQHVKTGQLLAILENSDLLLLQQKYLEACNLLEFFSREYARQGELTVENATSMKKLEASRKDYQSAELNYHTLRKQIMLLGLNPDSLSYDKLHSDLQIKATSTGLITGLNVHRGIYLKKGQKLFDLASKQTVLIKLLVPEYALMHINENQEIKFTCVPDSMNTREAIIRSKEIEIDPVSHTVTILALPKGNEHIIPGASVKAVIIASNPIE